MRKRFCISVITLSMARMSFRPSVCRLANDDDDDENDCHEHVANSIRRDVIHKRRSVNRDCGGGSPIAI